MSKAAADFVFAPLPEPRPSYIDLGGDRFAADDRLANGGVDHSGIELMLAKSPSERLAWNEAWRQYIRVIDRRGESVPVAVYGKPHSDELR